MTETMTVELTDEHLRRMRKSSTTGLLELIKNGLDAGARNVTVTFARTALGAIDTVTVEDDGLGMNTADVRDYFRPLSLSWKRNAGRQASLAGNRRYTGRELFGRKGEGRITAFAVGNHITWTSAWNDEKGLHCHRITWTDDQFQTGGLYTVAAGEPEALTKAGTRVTIGNGRPASERLQASKTREFLETKLGVFLEKYPEVTVTLDGTPLSPANVQGPRAIISVPVPDETKSSPRFAGCSETAELEVIEWRIPVSSAVWVAGPTGAPSDEIPFRDAHPGLAYTA